jgi:autoinducer 2-degrading protein
MELKPGKEALFLDIFDQVKSDIRSQKGCMGIELLRSHINEVTSLWTISSWQSEEDLESYRASPLFEKTWASVKPLFSDKARAWTLTSIETLT